MEKKIKDMNDIVVSAGVLSEFLGIGQRHIRRLADEGLLKKNSNGRYLLKESVYNYCLNLRVSKTAGNHFVNEELDLDTEKAKHEKIKREMAELKLMLMRGECHKKEDVRLVLADMLGNFKTRCLALPAKLAPQLVIKSDRAEIQEFLKAEIDKVLLELHEYDPKDFYGKEFISEEEGEDDEEYEENEEDGGL